ncbi:MOSC domain-containing protein [Aeromicrobium sp. CF3.5]|uniref:MOSC domain-containing protein n=1 Tax=Aeromicrobium sp. CF3.5 TaxID=3373078 RepID=UPI003EE6A1DB
MKISGLHLYPVKATGPFDLDTAEVDLRGLRHDRRWAVVDAAGKVLHDTTHDVLMTVTARPVSSGDIVLSAPACPDLHVPRPKGGAEIEVDLSRLPALVDAGDAAASWLSAVVGESVRLGWQPDDDLRPVAVNHGGRGDEPLSLADTGPLLLTTTASLRQLDAWIAADHEAQPMVMRRFRPNVVIDSDLEPFVEDDWRTITIGAVRFRFAEHCDRCVVTTIDPSTRARGKEPIRTLAKHRHWDRHVWFGIRIVPMSTGEIAVGDAVTAD